MNDVQEQKPTKEEQFNQLPTEERYQIVKTFLDIIGSAVADRMRILSSVSALAATMLVVATFNQDLVPLNTLARVLLSLLLSIIPISLLIYNKDLKDGQKRASAHLKEYTGIFVPDSEKTSWDKFASISPDILIWVITTAIIVLIAIIWGVDDNILP